MNLIFFMFYRNTWREIREVEKGAEKDSEGADRLIAGEKQKERRKSEGMAQKIWRNEKIHGCQLLCCFLL